MIFDDTKPSQMTETFLYGFFISLTLQWADVILVRRSYSSQVLLLM